LFAFFELNLEWPSFVASLFRFHFSPLRRCAAGSDVPRGVSQQGQKWTDQLAQDAADGGAFPLHPLPAAEDEEAGALTGQPDRLGMGEREADDSVRFSFHFRFVSFIMFYIWDLIVWS
jgi:hypothetical protein